MEINTLRTSAFNIVFVGNYLPRRCGIATFTTDLLTAVANEARDMEIWSIAMNDVPEGYLYPEEVRFELDDKNLSQYQLAAEFLNMNQVDAVCLQHEYGIFGGNHGSHILEFINNLRMPVVTTLHTVLREPTQEQKAILEEIGYISERIAVMSQRAEKIIREVYTIPEEKITLIHHGIPEVPFIDPNYFKDQFGVEGRKVILTFGLVSPGKGIEHMIEALPEIVKRLREEGEEYRFGLQFLAKDKGVEDNIIFHNRFVDLKELCEFLGASDIYVTPYLDKDQIVSGTLAYALGTGNATVSTPYWYAEEMLAEGRGRIVPFQDPEALAGQVINLLDDEVERHAIRKRAYTYTRNMIWKEVAKRYLDLFMEIKRDREIRPSTVFEAKTLKVTQPEVPQPKLDYIKLMTDDVGIIQHAKFIVPDRTHGYTTDDNARALIAVLRAQDFISDENELMALTCRYLSFVHYAFNETTGRFRNFMGYDRKWLEEEGTEDCHGRSILGLGMTVGLSKSESLTGMAMVVLKKALPVMTNFESPRAWAFGLVGLHSYLEKFSGDTEVRRIKEKLAKKLFELYRANVTKDWPWIENTVNYANAKIPQAMILSGRWLCNSEMIQDGLQSLEWLLDIQTDSRGHFAPIGNHGWYSKDGSRARFDQQPIEAQNMIDACIEAYKVTGDQKWIEESRMCFDWFLGRNDLNIPLYDYSTGGCRDGLTADGANQNEGAESTLAWLLSLFDIYSLPGFEVVMEKVVTREREY
jgi:glycosyltransferase involved in cell wall biosynthesis